MSNHNYLKIKETVDLSLKSEKLDNLINYCKQNDILFVDKEFPPEQKSLVGNPPAQDYNGQWNNITWQRASTLFGEKKYDIFRGITPSDIRQGALGNCYFLCSLASLAEYPTLISRLFEFDKCNEFGIHAVWLNINGVWRQIILDEYFPSVNDGRKYQLAFSKTDQKELWVILLEKAYAKAYGSYWEIIGGDPVHALRDLTGAPYDRIEDFANEDAAWEKLMTSNINQYMMTCFTYSTQQTEEQSQEGLVSGHAYTILDVRQVIDSNNKQRRIVQIRNPWGKFEWNGDFSDNSPLWTAQTKRKLQVTKNDDGIFWMPFEQFIKRFQGVGILKIIPGAISNAIQIDQKNSNKSVVKLNVRSNSQLMLSVDQTDSRLVDNPQYEYSYIRVTLGKVENEKIIFIDSILSPERNIFLEKKLARGEYAILIESYWTSDINRKLNVGTYSTGNVEIGQMGLKNDKYNKIEYLIWKNFCQNNQDKMEQKESQQIRNEQETAQLQKFCLNKQKYANIVYSFVNTSKKNSVHEILNIERQTGFDLNGKMTSGSKAELIVNPLDNDILLFKMDPRSSSFSLSYKTFNKELIQGKFSDNQMAIQLIQEMGGIQITPDNPKAKIISKKQQNDNFQQNKDLIQKRDAQRMERLQDRQRAVEEKRKLILQEMKEQAEFYANHGGMSEGFLGGHLANLAQQQQKLPLQNQWSNRFIETLKDEKKSVCEIF